MPKKFIQRSVLFVVFLATFFSYTAEASSNTASLFLRTSTTTVLVGDPISIDVVASSVDQSINAVSGSIQLPPNFVLNTIDTNGSIVSSWIPRPPSLSSNVISFEGIALPPYQGSAGFLFSFTGYLTKSGSSNFSFNDGSLLANDGLGTNILSAMQNLTLAVKNNAVPVPVAAKTIKPIAPTNKTTEIENTPTVVAQATIIPSAPALIAPDITDVTEPEDQSGSLSITGKGMPNTVTHLQFAYVSHPSLAEKIASNAYKNSILLTSADITDNSGGIFSYISPSNLTAGVYNATPSVSINGAALFWKCRSSFHRQY